MGFDMLWIIQTALVGLSLSSLYNQFTLRLVLLAIGVFCLMFIYHSFWRLYLAPFPIQTYPKKSHFQEWYNISEYDNHRNIKIQGIPQMIWQFVVQIPLSGFSIFTQFSPMSILRTHCLPSGYLT